MKAFLLAAGMGTRLRPYTDTLPKCLIPIHGKPLLDIWIDLFQAHGIDSVLINTHHHAALVEQAVQRLRVHKTPDIQSVFERELLGSGGTLLANRGFVEPGEDFIVAYADNLTNVDLTALIDFHQSRPAVDRILTMGLFRSPVPQACGIATLDADQTVTAFEEKPENPQSDLANAGIYVATYNVLGECHKIRQQVDPGVFDFGYHVLPRLAGRMSGYEIKAFLMDVGTVASYHKALDNWPARNKETEYGL